MAEGVRESDGYKKRCAANDLLGLSSAVALLMKGIESRLSEEKLRESFTEEQQERLEALFLDLHTLAEDVADLARELVE